ncbi:hypothetical protein [Gorillibacterium sp. sgz500922]|uniref:WD40/YVTN/BNR-like repeat-containing protein n=1 Tax=Gorillibacterium sp. sgz500922 TaxID=3446694 RepID=UPI003F672F6F
MRIRVWRQTAWLVLLTVLFLAASAGCSRTKETEKPLAALFPVYAGTDAIWAVDEQGRILRSTDRGKRFFRSGPVEMPAEKPKDVYFLSSKKGWIIDAGGQLYRTFDGGSHWKKLSDLSRLGKVMSVADFSFYDALHGWINLGGSLLQTEDGGETWVERVDQFSGWTLKFTTILEGWSLSDLGLMKTQDGGRNWKLVQPRTGDELQSVSFSDRRHGSLTTYPTTGMDQAAKNLLLLTSDGGQTWSAPPSLPAELEESESTMPAIRFWGAYGFAESGSGKARQAYYTADGGAHWRAFDLQAGTEATLPWILEDGMLLFLVQQPAGASFAVWNPGAKASGWSQYRPVLVEPAP